MNQYIHTPEGVRDIYGREFAARLEVRKKIRTVFHRFGYQDIRTPSFEFFDIFSKEKGSVISRELFKFFDREGETMVLRPDMTPAIARCAVKYFGEETFPLRLSYIGNNFINRSSLQGRLKEFTQAGVELIGDGSADADAEILALTVSCLLESGLKEFQVEVGHVGVLQGLLEEAELSREDEDEITGLLENKNYFGVEEEISVKCSKPEVREVFCRLPELFGSVEKLQEAKEVVYNPKSRRSIEHLEQVYRILCFYGLEQYISFDLGMTAQYRYYNGMIFKGYTYGSGEPIAAGGRYDNLMEQFGKKSEAVGFGILLDAVMAALSRQKIQVSYPWPDTMLLYPTSMRQKAIEEACRLRESGCLVTLQNAASCLDKDGGQDRFVKEAREKGYRKILMIGEDGMWQEAEV